MKPSAPVLQAVIEDPHLNDPTILVIPVTDGIDQCFPQGAQGVLPRFLPFDMGWHNCRRHADVALDEFHSRGHLVNSALERR
jgi:hypothetical protein